MLSLNSIVNQSSVLISSFCIPIKCQDRLEKILRSTIEAKDKAAEEKLEKAKEEYLKE